MTTERTYVYLEEDTGTREEDLGSKPFSLRKGGTAQTGRLGWLPERNEAMPEGEVHYPLVLSDDTFTEVNRLNYIPPEEVENTIFGYPVEDHRFLILADTNSYGIDPTVWSTNTSLSNESVLSNASISSFWNKSVGGVNGSAVNRCVAEYGGIESYPVYGDTCIELTIAPNSSHPRLKLASCTTKQVFDCEAATNLFISFALRRENASNAAVSKAGIFSNETGWYLEILGDGEGNNFRIVRRFTDLDGRVRNIVYPRSTFTDRLNGQGNSGLNLRFDYLTMFGIEIGSYDGTACSFYVYAADSATDSHRWIRFHKIGISDTGVFPERNASSLPITIIHEDTGRRTVPSILAKYGTSVVKNGVKTTPTKIFSAAGQFQELVAEKEVFILGILTRDLYNNKNNYTKHLPKYISVNSNVPTELVIRRYLLNENSIKGLSFKNLLQQEYDTSNLIYVVRQNTGYIDIVSPVLQNVIKTVKISAKNIYYCPENTRLYATQNNSSNIAVINGSDGELILEYAVPGVSACNDIICTFVNGLAKLFVSHTADNLLTVLDVTNEIISVIKTISVTSPNQLAAGVASNNATHVFISHASGFNAYNASSNNIDSISVQNTPSNSQGISIAHNSQNFVGQNVFLLTNNGKMLVYDFFNNNYTYNHVSSAQSGLITSADIIEVVDSINWVYVGSSTTNGYNLITYTDNAPVINYIETNYRVTGISFLDNLYTYLYTSLPTIRELLTRTTLINLNAPTSLIRGNLLASGISALTRKGLESVGSRVASFITGNKPRQINVVDIFHESREFFSSTYKTSGQDVGILGQDLILFYLKNVGELLSTHEEDVVFNQVVGVNRTTYTSTTTSYHQLNVGSGTISLITGQT